MIELSPHKYKNDSLLILHIPNLAEIRLQLGEAQLDTHTHTTHTSHARDKKKVIGQQSDNAHWADTGLDKSSSSE